MATISQIRKRIDKIELQRNPPPTANPPFLIFHPSDSPEETAAKEKLIADYDRDFPNGPPSFAIHLTSYLKPGDR